MPITIKHVFPDTNLFLHFIPLDEIDWLTELKADEVNVIIAPIVLRELNRQKDSSGSQRLRKRGAQAIKNLDRFSGAPQLRRSVKFEVQAADPQIDFHSHNLSTHVPDDWLIAGCIQFTANHSDVCVVTEDLGLRMKLTAHNIPTFRLPDKYRLPEEADADTKLISELREKIRTLTNRLPDVSLTFADGTDRLEIRLIRSSRVPEGELDSKMQNLRIRFPKLLKNEAYSGADLARGTVASPAAVDNYNAKLDQFYSEVLIYLHDYESFVDTQNRLFCFELSMINAGTAPAEDIDVDLNFPDGLEVLGQHELPKAPTVPEPPRLPVSGAAASTLETAELLRSMPEFALIPLFAGSRTTIWSNAIRDLTIRKGSRYTITLNVKDVKHLNKVSLGRLCVRFVSWEAVKSFSIDYSLLPRNLPTPAQGTLSVVARVVGE